MRPSRPACARSKGTLNGIGERCGNANLVTLIPTLALKDTYSTRFETTIDAERLVNLTRLSHAFDELLNRSPDHQLPYVGASAFATKAGIHASALLKDPRTYEHVPPESVGNYRKVMVSDQGGKANFINALKRRGIEVAKDDPKLDRLISIVKEREASGYAYEGADASFELLARRTLGTIPEFFSIEGFRVMVERRFDSHGRVKIVSEAVVKMVIDGHTIMSVAEGDGPVNALDLALRKDFGKYQHEIDDLVLADFKVRILNGGTEAITRVLIESTDSDGLRWWTVGVSENIIDASFQALMDSVHLQADEEPSAGGQDRGGVKITAPRKKAPSPPRRSTLRLGPQSASGNCEPGTAGGCGRLPPAPRGDRPAAVLDPPPRRRRPAE